MNHLYSNILIIYIYIYIIIFFNNFNNSNGFNNSLNTLIVFISFSFISLSMISFISNILSTLLLTSSFYGDLFVLDQYFFLLIFYLWTDGWMEFGGSVKEGSFEECFVVGGSVEEYSVWGVLSLMVLSLLVVVVWSVGGGSVEEYFV